MGKYPSGGTSRRVRGTPKGALSDEDFRKANTKASQTIEITKRKSAR